VYSPGLTANVNRPAASVSIVDMTTPDRLRRMTWLRTGTVGQPVSGSTAHRFVTVVPVIAVRSVTVGLDAGGVAGGVTAVPDEVETVDDGAEVAPV
jgi:hypothetical protein